MRKEKGVPCSNVFTRNVYAVPHSAGKLKGTEFIRCLIRCVHVGGGSRCEFTFVSEYEGRRTEKKKKKERIKRLKGKWVNYNVR